MNYIFIFALLTSVLANNWATYPSVPKTASINGFADPINSKLPSCAQDCVKLSTGNTPCPYWDTGCLCVMPQWSGSVAECIVESCKASDVASATALAYSLCSKVGANVWMMPASISSKVSSAASGVKVAVSTTSAEAEESDMSSGQSAAVTSAPSSTDDSSSSTKASSSKASSKASSTGSSESSSTANGAASVVINYGILGFLITGAFSYLA